MKKILSILISICLIAMMIPSMALAETNTTYSSKLDGSFGNTFKVDNLYFNPDSQFHLDNTKFDLNLAIMSLVVSLNGRADGSANKFLTTLGFEANSIKSFDFNRTGKEEYMTGYTYAKKKITRDGKDCTLLLVSVNSSSQDDGNDTTSGWSSVLPDLDFLNNEMNKKNGMVTDFESTKALTFTMASELILSGSSNVPSGQSVSSLVDEMNTGSEDYLVWVVGQSRGGAVGNYLSKLLIDKYGKEHVVSYLFSVPNVDKEAANSSTTKYNTIFNIVNPDDVVTYVPFGAEGGAGWGYTRWGVDISLDCLKTAEDAVIEKQKEIYKEFTANSPKDRLFYSDTTYFGYSEKYGNGVAVTDLVKSLSSSIENPEEYYNGKVSYSAETEKNNDGINILSYLIDYKDGKKGLLDVFSLIKTAATSDCDLNGFVTFVIKHILGYPDYLTVLNQLLLPNMTNISNIKVVAHEAYIAHTPENYLSWLLAEKEVNGTLSISGKSVIKSLNTASTKTNTGKKAIKISWTKLAGNDVDYYQIYRSEKKSSGYKKIYTTKNNAAKSYTDKSTLKKGTKYYYKIRGVKELNGKKVYSAWSKVAVRTFK